MFLLVLFKLKTIPHCILLVLLFVCLCLLLLLLLRNILYISIRFSWMALCVLCTQSTLKTLVIYELYWQTPTFWILFFFCLFSGLCLPWTRAFLCNYKLKRLKWASQQQLLRNANNQTQRKRSFFDLCKYCLEYGMLWDILVDIILTP